MRIFYRKALEWLILVRFLALERKSSWFLGVVFGWVWSRFRVDLEQI
jgi:hypothetical protein